MSQPSVHLSTKQSRDVGLQIGGLLWEVNPRDGSGGLGKHGPGGLEVSLWSQLNVSHHL